MLIKQQKSLIIRNKIKKLKYLILIFMITAAVLGFSLIQYFDPIVVFERTLLLIVFPVVSFFVSIFTIKSSFAYTERLFALLLFAIIVGLNVFAKRFWCRNICPLGGLFAFLSKFSLFKFFFGTGCKQCALCEKVCPTEAIDFKNERIDSGECIVCINCIYECPETFIKYKM
ncbi:MAG: 4Fe-4S binding protein, partial [candidate division WOR-3 bacterium]